MENAYGIGVKNRYELFYDEDVDPLEIIRQQEEEKEKRKTDKIHPKDKNKNTKSTKPIPVSGVPKKSKDVSNVIAPNPSEMEVTNKTRPRPLVDRTSKANRNFEDAKDGEERNFFRNREDHPPTSGFETRERDGEGRRGRGGFRGRGRARGRGTFFNYDNRPPRREFDRQSGSDKMGIKPIEKRDGSGSNNWSDVKNDFGTRRKEPESSWMDEEIETSGEKLNESTWMETIQDSGTTKEIDADKSAEELLNENIDSKENLPILEDHTEESVKEMTLDEWKREQEAKRTVPKYNLRKPGEGEDGNQWKKLYMLKKKAKEDDDDEEEEDEDIDDDEFARRGRHRQLIDIQINFNDSRRGRGRGRGIRGVGPRSGPPPISNKDVHREDRREPLPGPNAGRSYRGSMKVNKSGQQSAPRVDDWNDFPSLVTA